MDNKKAFLIPDHGQNDKPMTKLVFYQWLCDHSKYHYMDDLKTYLAFLGFNKKDHFIPENDATILRYTSDTFYSAPKNKDAMLVSSFFNGIAVKHDLTKWEKIDEHISCAFKVIRSSGDTDYYNATPRPELVKHIKKEMLYDQGVYFNIIEHEYSYTLHASYDRIIGSRQIAYISKGSIDQLNKLIN